MNIEQRLRRGSAWLAACLAVLLAVAGGLGLPSVASAQPPSSERQVLKCYEEGVVLSCEQDQLQELINQAGTTPTRIEIGNATQTLVTKTLVIPAGADIELVDTAVAPWGSNSSLVREDGDFTGSLIRIEKGGKLTLSDGTADGNGVTIDSRAKYDNVVTGSSFAPTITVEGELVMNAGSVTGARKVSGTNRGAVTVKGKDATFTLNGGTITDNHREDDAQFGAANVALTDGATMVMNGGEISKGQTRYSPYAYGEAGGIGIFNGAHLTVDGGKITDNTGWAGNINVSHWLNESSVKPGDDTTDTRSTLEINDGEISNGSAAFGGGGINIFGNAQVTMNGGNITGNRAPNGGGVNAMDMYINGDPRTYKEIDSDGSRWTKQHFGEPKPEEWTKVSPAGFTMNGGSITGNSATRTGGGVNVISNAVKLNAGSIEENNADQQGGGVYVATKSYTAHFMDALITDNSAKPDSYVAYGGGVWLCPTGSLTMHVTNGVAIFDNVAPESATSSHWGDDIAHDNLGSSNAARMLIDSRMLGGGEATYYRDGASAARDRFDANNPGKEQVFDGTERASDETHDYKTKLGNEGLKTVADTSAKERAKSWARLTIQKNYAPRGAGVGSNGTLVFGTPEKTDVKVTKAWKTADGKDLDAKSTVPVEVQLIGKVKIGKDKYEKFELGSPVKLNAKNAWKHTFKDLPQYKVIDGKRTKIAYSVEERAVEGFASAVLGDAEMSFTVTDLAQKDPVKVQLVKTVEGKTSVVGEPVELNGDNKWIHTFMDLPKTEKVDGKDFEVTYSVTQSDASGPNPALKGVSTVGFTVTNTQTPPPTTSVDVLKVWKAADGSALDAESTVPVEVQLMKSTGGEKSPVGELVELNADNDWSHTFTDLPVSEKVDGKKLDIQYSVEELSVEGFTSEVSGDAEKGFTITNTQTPPPVTEVSVTKVWKAADGSELDPSETQPVKVQLVKTVGDATSKVGDPVELNADNGWKYTFTNLPVTEKVDGEKLDVTYSVEELAVEGFTSKVTGDAEKGFTITNTENLPATTEVPVEKVWKDADGADLEASETQPVKVQLTKTVNGETTKVGDPVELNADNDWKHTFTDLPATEKIDGKKVDVTYSVEELKIEGFTTEVTGNVNDGFTITNTENPPATTGVDVLKVWKDAEGAELDAESTTPVKVQLVKTVGDATSKVGDPVELNADNGWKYTFTNLPVTEKVDGKKLDVTYSVEEIAVSGFKSELTGDAENGFVLTNTQIPPVSEVPVEKVWEAADGSELDSSETQPVKVQLVKTVGDATSKVGDPVELNADNGWKYTFTNLPVTEKVDGKKVDIQYSVEELSVEGFTSRVTGNAQDGFLITNTQTPPPVTEVNVSKIWKAADGSELDPSATVPVKVQLVKTLAGKTTPVGDPVVLNAPNGWKHSFTQLPIAEEVDGQPVDVTYSVEELAVEGFTSKVTGNAQDGFTITNTQTPPPPTPTPEPSPTPEPTPTPGPTPGKPRPRPSMPRTGADGGSPAVWAVAGLLGIGTVLASRRRR